MRQRHGGVVLVVLGAIGLILGLLVAGVGVVVMMHSAKNQAIAERNLDRIKAEADSFSGRPQSPMRDHRIMQMYDEQMTFGGMKAETERNLMIGLGSFVVGLFFAIGGGVVLLIGILWRPAPRAG